MCLMCLKDTCTLEDKMLKDPRRLYAPGRLYHIIVRKPFRYSSIVSFMKILMNNPIMCTTLSEGVDSTPRKEPSLVSRGYRVVYARCAHIFSLWRNIDGCQHKRFSGKEANQHGLWEKSLNVRTQGRTRRLVYSSSHLIRTHLSDERQNFQNCPFAHKKNPKLGIQYQFNCPSSLQLSSKG